MNGSIAVGPPRYSLRTIMHTLHRMLEGPLVDADHRAWKDNAASFGQTASVVLRYEKYGPRHPRLYKIGGVTVEEALDSSLIALIAKARAMSNREEAQSLLLQSGL